MLCNASLFIIRRGQVFVPTLLFDCEPNAWNSSAGISPNPKNMRDIMLTIPVQIKHIDIIVYFYLI